MDTWSHTEPVHQHTVCTFTRFNHQKRFSVCLLYMTTSSAGSYGDKNYKTKSQNSKCLIVLSVSFLTSGFKSLSGCT